MKAQNRPISQWIVVDDGKEPTKTTMGQEVIRLDPMEGHSLARNLLAALPRVACDAVMFWEDDDYYNPDWSDMVNDRLETPSRRTYLRPQVVGEGVALYYNVRRRRAGRWNNCGHCSLAMTAICKEVIPAVMAGPVFNPGPGDAQEMALIDWRLWHTGLVRQIWLPASNDRPGVVGMKGMPGRTGMAGGHSDEHAANYLDDVNLGILRACMGDDADTYAPFYAGPVPAETAKGGTTPPSAGGNIQNATAAQMAA